jgi:hypothetical protein
VRCCADFPGRFADVKISTDALTQEIKHVLIETAFLPKAKRQTSMGVLPVENARRRDGRLFAIIEATNAATTSQCPKAIQEHQLLQGIANRSSK